MKHIAKILLLAACLVFAGSCSKPLTKTIAGEYHFKMSGNFTGVNVQNPLQEIRFVLKSQTGRMTILNDTKEGHYIVNMSVMMGGDVMSFRATVSDDVMTIQSHEIVLSVLEEGDSSSAADFIFGSGTSVVLTLSGQGAMFDDTLMLQMKVEGTFNYDDTRYEAVDNSCDIFCMAERQ